MKLNIIIQVLLTQVHTPTITSSSSRGVWPGMG